VLLISSESLLVAGVKTKVNYKTITVNIAKELIENTTDLFILDVRTPNEFKDGHISGAYLIPNTEINNRQDDLPVNKSHPILVYCRSGMRSAAASNALDLLNYTHVNNMDGGFIAWKNAGYSFETGPFSKPITNTTSSSLTTSGSSSDGLKSSSSTTSIVTPGFEILIIFLAICLTFMRSKKR
jgi:rhodanese-related sulfurtransferase